MTEHARTEPDKAGTLGLTLAAMGAAATFQLALLLPLALSLALPALFYRSTFMAAACVLGFLVLAWVAQPAAAEPPEILPRAGAPALYAWLEALCRRLDAPRIDAIALDGRLNAGALELHRGFSLRPTRRILVLGMPTLAILTAPMLEAVVAHELAHFSRQHGRLGHWLYRTRAAWAALLQQDSGQVDAWERAAMAFAQWFVPRFERASLAHARRCEREADALAARTATAEAMAAALVRLELASLRLGRTQSRSQHLADRLHHAAPPARALDDLRRQAWDAGVSAEEREALMGRQTTAADSHPCLADRLAALSMPIDPLAPGPGFVSAGEALAGPHWQQLVETHEAARLRAQTLPWRMAHAALGVLAARREALGAAGTVSAEAMRLAWALHQAPEAAAAPQDTDTPLDEHKALQAFHRAIWLLEAGDAAAARPWLAACLRSAPAWAAPARRHMARHAAAMGLSPAEAASNLQRLRAAEARRTEAEAQMLQDIESGRCTVPADPVPLAALRAALALAPAIHEAWLVQGHTVLPRDRHFDGLVVVLRLDLDALTRQGLDEDAQRDQVLDLMRYLVPPPGLRVARSSFTREGMPPALQACLNEHAGCRVK